MVLVALCWLASDPLRGVVAAIAGRAGTLERTFGDYVGHVPTVCGLWLVLTQGLAWASRRSGRSVPSWLHAVGPTVGSALTFAALNSLLWPTRRYSVAALTIFAIVASATAGLWEQPSAGWRQRLVAAIERIEAGVRRVVLDALSRRPTLGRWGAWGTWGLGAGLLAAGYVGVAWHSGGVPCAMECGNSHDAYIAVLNQVRFGAWGTAGLPDFGLSAHPGGHPKVYTHQPFVAVWVSYIGRVLGIREVEGQALLVLPVWAGGLTYMARFVGGAAGQRLLGGLMLVAAGTLYPLVTLWVFNLLRVFSWLVVWGSAYHAWRYGQGGKRWHRAVMLVYLGLAFGIDYASGVCVGVQLLVLARLGVVHVPWRRLLGWQALAAGGVVLVHQGQIVAAFGPAAWAGDVLDVVSRRLPLGGLVVGAFEALLPAAWLRDAAEQAAGSLALQRWPGGLRHGDPSVWVASLATASVEFVGWPLVLVAAGAAAAVWSLRSGVARERRAREGGAVEAMLNLVGAHVASLLVAVVLFGQHFVDAASTGIPFLVHPITLLLALAGWVALGNTGRVVQRPGWRLPAGALLLAAFVAWRVGAEWRNYQSLPAWGLPGRVVLKELRGHTFAATVWGPLVAAHTHDWAFMLTPGGWRELAMRMPETGRLRFLPDERHFLMFPRIVPDPGNPAYMRPDFLYIADRIPYPMARCWRGLDPPRREPAPECAVARAREQLRHLALYAEGPGYLIYDLRPVWARQEER